MSELPKTYDPKSVEDKLYKFWVDSASSTPRSIRTRNRTPSLSRLRMFTGQLHMGHAFDETLQDILIRTKRMQGYEALDAGHRPRLRHCNPDQSRENLRKEEWA